MATAPKQATTDTREAARTQPSLPFARPDIGEEEIAEVVDALRSGWITTGPKVHRFENDFCETLGVGQRSTGERAENREWREAATCYGRLRLSPSCCAQVPVAG